MAGVEVPADASDESLQLSKEFEEEMKVKMAAFLKDADESTVSTVGPVEIRKTIGPEPEEGIFIEDIPVGPNTKAEDVSMSVTGRILTVLIQVLDDPETGEGEEEMHMMSLPRTVDVFSLTLTLQLKGEEDSILRIQGNYQPRQKNTATSTTIDEANSGSADSMLAALLAAVEKQQSEFRSQSSTSTTVERTSSVQEDGSTVSTTKKTKTTTSTTVVTGGSVSGSPGLSESEDAEVKAQQALFLQRKQEREQQKQVQTSATSTTKTSSTSIVSKSVSSTSSSSSLQQTQTQEGQQQTTQQLAIESANDQPVPVVIEEIVSEEEEQQKQKELLAKQEAEAEEQRKKQEEIEALQRQQEAEQLKKQQEIEALQKQQEEEQRKKQEEILALQKAQEAEQLRKQQEIEALQKAQEAEQLRKQQEIEALQKQQEAEQLQKQQEEIERLKKQQEEEQRKKQEEIEALQKIQEAEQLKKQQEIEALQKAQEAEQLRKQQEIEALQKQKEAEEAARQKEIEEQQRALLEKEQEIERQKELERQKRLERQRLRQLAEQEKQREIQLAFELHNKYRTLHRVPNLLLVDRLCELAESYAATLASGKEPSYLSILGRNTFKAPANENGEPTMTGEEAVTAAVEGWYSTGQLYNWANPKKSPPAAKTFSSLLWKGTDRVGVGVGKKEGVVAVVVLYCPQGNMATEKAFKDNVFKPKA